MELGDLLTPSEVASVLALVEEAGSVDGVSPLSEQTLLHLETLRLEGIPLKKAQPAVRHVLARLDGRLAGYAQLESTGTAELVVAPAARLHGVGGALLDRLDVMAGEALQVWAHGELAGAAALAAGRGFVRSRVLLQLRLSLAASLPDPAWPAGVAVRTFVVGADEEAWLRVNNAAFATHPEQGRWTMNDVQQREAQNWFDPAGFFLAEREGELIGFHWTKVHTEQSPPIGEVYVVGVRPQDSGQGLGPALTLTGLHHLRSLGLGEVLLYVDESNSPAVKTYGRLGFGRWASDVLYTRAR